MPSAHETNMMDPMEIPFSIPIGITLGYLASRFNKGKGFGRVDLMVVGVLGGSLGSLLAELLVFTAFGIVGTLFVVSACSALFVFIAAGVEDVGKNVSSLYLQGESNKRAHLRIVRRQAEPHLTSHRHPELPRFPAKNVESRAAVG